jgi:Nitroreductase family
MTWEQRWHPLREEWVIVAAHHNNRPWTREQLPDLARGVPALRLVSGGALLWVVGGDGPRVAAKYGGRGLRFLLPEAGHLMQNLCVLSASLGLATVPLGGAFEGEVARALGLPETDDVLYVGACGRPT